jgi:acyl carrier protein
MPEVGIHEWMAEVLMCEPEALPPESTPLRDIEGWDSLKHVRLILELEKKLNAPMTEDEIQGIVTLEDVGRVLGKKSGNG